MIERPTEIPGPEQAAALDWRGRAELTAAIFSERGVEAVDDPELIEFVTPWIDPDFEGIMLVGSEIRFRGVQGWFDMLRTWGEAWDEARYEIKRWVERGDAAAAEVAYSVRGAGSGVEIDSRLGWVMRFREDRILELGFRNTFEDALADTGLTA